MYELLYSNWKFVVNSHQMTAPWINVILNHLRWPSKHHHVSFVLSTSLSRFSVKKSVKIDHFIPEIKKKRKKRKRKTKKDWDMPELTILGLLEFLYGWYLVQGAQKDHVIHIFGSNGCSGLECSSVLCSLTWEWGRQMYYSRMKA